VPQLALAALACVWKNGGGELENAESSVPAVPPALSVQACAAMWMNGSLQTLGSQMIVQDLQLFSLHQPQQSQPGAARPNQQLVQIVAATLLEFVSAGLPCGALM
jgi:hypothetical protein